MQAFAPANAPLPSSGAINLWRLVLVRAIVIAGQGVAVGVAVLKLGMALPLMPLAMILAALSVFAVLTLLRLRWPYPVRESELFGQLIVDVAALTGLLYFSGGATNPFVTLYLLPLAFAAAALPAIHAWAMAALATACYTLLLFHHVPLPASHAGHAHDFGLHVLGMWLGFVLSAALIAGFAARMSATLRERDRLAAQMREQRLRNERVLALGTLAAGAAHELGTPLSTLAVLSKDLAPGQALSADKLAILRGQIERCKEILGSLSASAGAARAEGGASEALDRWLGELVRKWLAMRPGLTVSTRFAGDEPAPRIVADQTLAQAITNILNNAADASPHSVEVDGRWNGGRLVLEIADRGPGLAPEVQGSVGEAVVADGTEARAAGQGWPVCGLSTKDPGQGLGLGLFLAYTTLNRFGGEVRILNREGGGTLCRITLPFDALRVDA